MAKIYAWDLETVPDPFMPEKCIPVFDRDTVKLGNLKDTAKIEAKITAKELEFKAGLIKKMSVDPWSNLPICFVGMVYNLTNLKFERTDAFYCNYGETDPFDFLHKIKTSLLEQYEQGKKLVTFNGTAFDFPTLRSAFIKHDVPFSSALYEKCTRKFDFSRHVDLMKALTDYGYGIQTGKGLDFFCQLFRIKGKPADFTPEDVFPAWKNGQMEKIAEYCKNDVEMTTNLYRSVAPWYGW